jgi:hypothetical protein
MLILSYVLQNVLMIPNLICCCAKPSYHLMSNINYLTVFCSYNTLPNKCLKMTVFWDIVPCSITEICRRFRDAYCPRHYPGDDDEGSKHP